MQGYRHCEDHNFRSFELYPLARSVCDREMYYKDCMPLLLTKLSLAHSQTNVIPHGPHPPHSKHAQYFRWERIVPVDPVSRRPRFRLSRASSSGWRARSPWRRRGGGRASAPSPSPPLSCLSPLPRRAPRPPAYHPAPAAGLWWSARAGAPPDTLRCRRCRHFQNFKIEQIIGNVRGSQQLWLLTFDW